MRLRSAINRPNALLTVGMEVLRWRRVTYKGGKRVWPDFRKTCPDEDAKILQQGMPGGDKITSADVRNHCDNFSMALWERFFPKLLVEPDYDGLEIVVDALVDRQFQHEILEAEELDFEGMVMSLVRLVKMARVKRGEQREEGYDERIFERLSVAAGKAPMSTLGII